jgi:hypothetical protein
MYENLPPHLKPATKYYSDELIEFKDAVKGTINSRVTTASVQPGHEGKGRGQTITDLHLTEPPFWRGDAAESSDGLLEAAAGGEVSIESTAFGIDWTHSVYTAGQATRGGWKSFFFEWWWKRSIGRGCTVRARPKERMDPAAAWRNAERVWSVPAARSRNRNELRSEIGLTRQRSARKSRKFAS